MVTKEKKIYLEVLRLLAIFMVLYQHTGERGRWHYQIAGNSLSYWLGIGMACFCIMCNFAFFTISGAVLLHKKETIKQVLLKRLVPMSLVFAIFTLLQYYLSYLANPIIGFDLKSYIYMLYSYDAIQQYWFFRAYLAFLIMLPFLRFLAQNMKKEHYFMLFGLYSLLEAVLPVWEFATGFPPFKMELPLLGASIVYPLLGYFTEHVFGEELKKPRWLIGVNLAGITAFCLYVAETHILYNSLGVFKEINGITFVMLFALLVDIRFICFKCKMKPGLCKLVTFAGTGVFGIYLLEPQSRELTQWIYDGLVPYITWFGAVIVWLIAAMIPGILILNLLKRIPIINKIF